MKFREWDRYPSITPDEFPSGTRFLMAVWCGSMLGSETFGVRATVEDWSGDGEGVWLCGIKTPRVAGYGKGWVPRCEVRWIRLLPTREAREEARRTARANAGLWRDTDLAFFDEGWHKYDLDHSSYAARLGKKARKAYNKSLRASSKGDEE